MSTIPPTLEQPDWLAMLATAQARGLLPPYGIIWQDPPPKQTGRHSPPGGAGHRIPGHGHIMPARFRTPIVEYLARQGPGRWARIYDGSPNNCDALNRLMRTTTRERPPRRPLPAGAVQVTTRGFGNTVALFARYDLADG